MSELMKKLPIDAVKITIEKNKKKNIRFLVPKPKAQKLISLIKEFEINSKVNRDKINTNTADIFSDVNQKYSKQGAILRGARLKENLSQKKLAEKINFPQNYISKMEHGKKSIDKKTAQKLAKILKVHHKIFL